MASARVILKGFELFGGRDGYRVRGSSLEIASRVLTGEACLGFRI